MTAPALYLLDKNMIGYILRGESQHARQMLDETRIHSHVAVSAITEGEILFGLERKPEARRLHAAVEDFFQAIEVLAWDSEAGRAYAHLRSGLLSAGITLSQADLFIAAHAASLGAVLVSHDKAFQHVSPFLSVADWATDVKKAVP